MDIKEITEANRAAWNLAFSFHKKARKLNYLEAFQDPGFTALDNIEIQKLLKLGIHGKEVAQFCCNNGRELLSILRLGAVRGVGFDICDEAIEEANRVRDVTGLNCEFIRQDIFEISEDFNSSFDLIYMSVGVLNWLPDLRLFFQIAERLLRRSGAIFIYELHPATNMLSVAGEENYSCKDPFKITNSYFKTGIEMGTDGFDYVGKSKYLSVPYYEFNYRLCDIFNQMINARISIVEFDEFSHDISNLLSNIEADGIFPLSYILIGRKH